MSPHTAATSAGPADARCPTGPARAAGPLRARVLYTRYPHMGAHSGMVQLARHFDPTCVAARTVAVADGDDDFPIAH